MNIINRFKNQRLSSQIIEYNNNPDNEFELKSRQAHCLSSLRDLSSTVELWKEQGKEKAHYSGLQTCGSPWACPICAIKISEFRKDELEILIKKAQERGKHIYMLTFTLPHYAHESCQTVLDKFRESKKKMKDQQPLKKSPFFKPWSVLKKQYDYEGSVTTLEVLYGPNGWHVHSHELFIFDEQIESQLQAREDFFEAWLKACDRSFQIADYPEHVFKGFVKRSLRLDYLTGDSKKIVSEYMTKAGIARKEKELDGWGMQHELTKGHLKKSEAGLLTPFGMLDRIRETEDEDEAYHLKQKYFEYTQAFKGASFVRWSPGLRAKYDLHYKSDEEIADGEADLLAKWYGYFEEYEWKELVVKNRLRGFIIENSHLEWNELVKLFNERLKTIDGSVYEQEKEECST